MSELKKDFILLLRFIFRTRLLHYVLGTGAFGLLSLEITKPKIPKEALPNYIEVAKENGEFVKIALGYAVDYFGSGPNYLVIAVLLIIILFCIYAEIVIHKEPIKAKNIFSGWFTINNQVNHYDKE